MLGNGRISPASREDFIRLKRDPRVVQTTRGFSCHDMIGLIEPSLSR